MLLGYIVIGATLLLPLLLGIAFRVGAPNLFFSLMAGELLARYFGNDVGRVAQPIAQDSSGTYGHIALLVAPMLLTSFFLRNTLSKGKTILHVVPFLITGIVLAAFLLPALPADIQSQVQTIPLGARLLNLNRVIIGGVVAIQLFALWWLNRASAQDKKSKNKS